MIRYALAALLLLTACTTAPRAPEVPAMSTALRNEFAPSGTLIVGVNFGNPVIMQKDPAGGEPRGVGAELARELARRLGVPVRYVTYDTAGKAADALKQRAIDISFLASDPTRATDIDFSAPYVEIEGTYLVRRDSPLRAIADVDREGIRIAVGDKTAYMEIAAKDPTVRVIDGNFMVIGQASGVPRGRPTAAQYLRGFIEEAKASGFVARALTASGVTDATVAPPAN